MGCLMLRELQLVPIDVGPYGHLRSLFSLVFDVSEPDDDAAISFFGSWCSSEK